MRSLLGAALAAYCLVAAGGLLNTRFDSSALLVKGGERWDNRVTAEARAFATTVTVAGHTAAGAVRA